MNNTYLDQETLEFLLYEVHDLEAVLSLPRYTDFDKGSVDMMLQSVKAFADRELAPCYREMDENPAHYADGNIIVHPKVPEYMKKSGEMGLIAGPLEAGEGGLQLPLMVVSAYMYIQEAANNHLPGYAGLTMGAAELLVHFAGEELRQRFVPKMLAGEWAGTMCLTEPQAGSSLSDIITQARPAGDSYHISGQKIFISGGDYEGIGNVVHLVLARIEGAPPGTKGISLFAVPKFIPGPDGSLQFNDVNTIGDFQKMGQRGYCTSHLSFGDKGECRGWLVGEPHQGLKYMFLMMNGARIAVGRGAAAIAMAAYQASLAYARERPQGRRLNDAGAKNSTEPQSLIIHHSDVKRMLLQQKVIAEGALSLVLLASRYHDLSLSHPEKEKRQEYHLLLEILTPVAKTYPAEKGIESVSQGLQVLGGYGFCADFILQQYYRDIRIFAIYEGTTGIQSQDLLGRKITMEDGKAYKLLCREIGKTISRAGSGELAGYAETLRESLEKSQEVITVLLEFAGSGNFERFLADATLVMEMMGVLVTGWQWLWMGLAASETPGNDERPFSDSFYQAKLQALEFYYFYEMPSVHRIASTILENDGITSRDAEILFPEN